jgi:hypothetical protein
MPLRWWPRKWQMQIKQLRWRQNSTINYLKATKWQRRRRQMCTSRRFWRHCLQNENGTS